MSDAEDRLVCFILLAALQILAQTLAQLVIPPYVILHFGRAAISLHCTAGHRRCMWDNKIDSATFGRLISFKAFFCVQNTCNLLGTSRTYYSTLPTRTSQYTFPTDTLITTGSICPRLLVSTLERIFGSLISSPASGERFGHTTLRTTTSVLRGSRIIGSRSDDTAPATSTITPKLGSGLSAGSTAAIVLGVLLGVFLVGAGCCFWCCSYPFREKKRRTHTRIPTTFAERTGQIRPTERVYDDRDQLTVAEMLENPVPGGRPTQPGEARLPGRTPAGPHAPTRVDGPIIAARPSEPVPVAELGTTHRSMPPHVENATDGRNPPPVAPAIVPPGTARAAMSRSRRSRPSEEEIAPVVAAATAAGVAAALSSRAHSQRSRASPMMSGARPVQQFDVHSSDSETTITLSTEPSGTPIRSSTESQVHRGSVRPPRVVPRPSPARNAVYGQAPSRTLSRARTDGDLPPPPQAPAESHRNRSRSRGRSRPGTKRRPPSPSSSSSSEGPPERKRTEGKKKKKRSRNLGILGAIGATAIGMAADQFRRTRGQGDSFGADLGSRRPRSRERRSSSQDTVRPPAQVESVSSSHSSVIYEEDESGELSPVPGASEGVSQVHTNAESTFSDSTLAPSDSGSQQGGSRRRAPPPRPRSDSKLKKSQKGKEPAHSSEDEETTTPSIVKRAKMIHLKRARARRRPDEPIEEVDEEVEESEEVGEGAESGTVFSSEISETENFEVEDMEAQDGPKRVRFTNKRRPGKG